MNHVGVGAYPVDSGRIGMMVRSVSSSTALTASSIVNQFNHAKFPEVTNQA